MKSIIILAHSKSIQIVYVKMPLGFLHSLFLMTTPNIRLAWPIRITSGGLMGCCLFSVFGLDHPAERQLGFAPLPLTACHRCDHCGKLLSTKLTLKRHKEQQHLQPLNNAVCNLCNKVFRTLNSLNNHRSIYHRRQK